MDSCEDQTRSFKYLNFLDHLFEMTCCWEKSSNLSKKIRLNVRQSRNVFFKPTIFPKIERTNAFFDRIVSIVYWKNSRIPKSPFAINWPLTTLTFQSIEHFCLGRKIKIQVFTTSCRIITIIGRWAFKSKTSLL